MIERTRKANPGPLPPVVRAFEPSGYGRVSTSASGGIETGYLLKTGRVCDRGTSPTCA